MPFHFAKLPHKLVANEWLIESTPSVWYRLSDAFPNNWVTSNERQVALQLKHTWVFVRSWPNGAKGWYVNGQKHRENGLPAVEWADGVTRWWYVNGRLHRDNDLPAAIRARGFKAWFVNGRKHRDGDLPAREWASGAKEWWVDGVFIRRE